MGDRAMPARVRGAIQRGMVNAPSVKRELYIIPSTQITTMPTRATDGTQSYTSDFVLRTAQAAVAATANTAAIPEIVGGAWTVLEASEGDNDFHFEAMGEGETQDGYKFEAKYIIYGLSASVIGFLRSCASGSFSIVVPDRNGTKWHCQEVKIDFKASTTPKAQVEITFKPLSKYGSIEPPTVYNGALTLR